MVEVPTGEAHEVDVFYCTVGFFGADEAAMMTTQAGEIINVFLKERRWKFTSKYDECNHVGYRNLLCGEYGAPVC